MSKEMKPLNNQTLESGQGLVEYALILVLVAVVVIVILSAVGVGVQRVFGVVGATLGAEHATNSDSVLEITTAQCIAVQSSGLTGMWVVGVTNLDAGTLTGSTEQGIALGIDGSFATVTDNGPGGFKFNPLLSNSADLSVCPQAVVIQSPNGVIALHPVEAVWMQ